MSICASGASEPLSSAPATVVLTLALAATFLPEDIAWVLPFLPFLATITFELPTYCAADPPSILSVPAAAEFAALAVSGETGSALAAAFLNSVVSYFYWFSVCQCTTGSLPAPSTPPTAPTGLPSINSPSAGFGTGAPCWSYTRSYSGVSSPLFVGQPGNTLYGSPGPYTGFGGALTLNAGTAFAATASMNVKQYDANNVLLSTGTSPTASPGQTVNYYFAAVPFVSYADFNLVFANTNGTSSFGVTTSGYCNGANPTNPIGQCCAPDPNLIGMLTNILGMTTLIQRQVAPFAYVHGTPITGLTGDGSISVQGLLGVLVTITSSLDAISSYDGTPMGIAGAGWLNWGNADGWASREFLTSSTQLSFPPAAGQYTLIGYSLGGATITITPLVRES